jgi:mRNA-degrading endonuclease RelE of RelBE toxin-antitoxin system
MSKLFFDHLIYMEEVEFEIKKTASSKEEQEELWGLVDEIVVHKVIGKVLDKLPRKHHEEFLELFHKSPHDEEIIFGYLKSKAGENIEVVLKEELENISSDILNEIKSSKK